MELAKHEYRSKWATSSTPIPAPASAVEDAAARPGDRHISAWPATWAGSSAYPDPRRYTRFSSGTSSASAFSAEAMTRAAAMSMSMMEVMSFV